MRGLDLLRLTGLRKAYSKERMKLPYSGKVHHNLGHVASDFPFAEPFGQYEYKTTGVAVRL